VAPLQLGGLRGKKSTPSIGWEVPGEVSTVDERELHGACGRHSQIANNNDTFFSFCIVYVVGFMLGSAC
jgi:hypothetical protein